MGILAFQLAADVDGLMNTEGYGGGLRPRS